MTNFTPTERALFFTRNDSSDPRLGELCKSSSDKAEVAILGYPDDEGIGLSGGRNGAAEGPDAIRHWLYRTTPHPRRTHKNFTDLGNLLINGKILERHNKAQEAVHSLMAKGVQTLSLGGGNDYAFPDAMAFLQVYEDKNPIVINVDAHLDVRSTDNGLNSGTPFFRLLESSVKFAFVELGAQTQCNARAHWDYVERKGAKIISWDEIADSGRTLVETVVASLGDLLLKRRPTFLAIDIDAFAWPYAMGASASWPLGLDPQAFWPLYQLLLKRLDVRGVGIYEVSPALDQGSGTARLAAQLAHGFLHHV